MSNFCAAASTSFSCAGCAGCDGLTNAANRDNFGKQALKSSICFRCSSGAKLVRPVTLPPGRARLAAEPSSIGLTNTVPTMGMV